MNYSIVAFPSLVLLSSFGELSAGRSRRSRLTWLTQRPVSGSSIRLRSRMASGACCHPRPAFHTFPFPQASTLSSRLSSSPDSSHMARTSKAQWAVGELADCTRPASPCLSSLVASSPSTLCSLSYHGVSGATLPASSYQSSPRFRFVLLYIQFPPS